MHRRCYDLIRAVIDISGKPALNWPRSAETNDAWTHGLIATLTLLPGGAMGFGN